MSSYGSLPVTGASVTLFGVVYDQVWLLAGGIMLVALGVAAIRLSWRRGQTVTSL